MDRQSSRIWYNGKDHKDVYFNGKYHKAMYLEEQGGFIWKKLPEENEVSYALLNFKANDTSITYPWTYWGVNVLYPESRRLDANVTKSYNYYYGTGSVAFDTIISGENRAFGIFIKGSQRIKYVWVTSGGRYWRRISCQNNVEYVTPCYNGFMYRTSSKEFYKVLLNSDNELISETLISSDFIHTSYVSIGANGVFGIDNGTNKVYYLTHLGNVIEYQIGSGIDGESYSLRTNFSFNGKAYIVLYEKVYWEEYNTFFYQFDFLSCDGMSIKCEGIVKDNPSESYNYWDDSANIPLVTDKNGTLYLYKREYDSTSKTYSYTIRTTTNFIDIPIITTWSEEEYIELSLVGGTWNNINEIRFYPVKPISASYNIEYVKKEDGNYIAKVYTFNPFNTISAYFIGETLIDSNSAIYEATRYGNSTIAIYLSSKTLEKTTTGFAYFTDNIGVGISYPESED